MSAGADVGRNDAQDLNYYAYQQLAASETKRKQLRANASLPKEAWKSIDDTVFQTMDAVLNIVDDLRAFGLTNDEDLNNKTTEWHVIDDDHQATVAMQPETATDEGNLDYDLRGAVLPIVQADFSIGFRDGGTATEGGGTASEIETLNAEYAARAVAEKMEDIVYNGVDFTVGNDGYTSYGLTNHPDVHTGSLSDWESDPSSVRDDLRGMFSDIKDDKFFPDNNGYQVYTSRDRMDRLEDIDPDGSGDLLVRDRVENLNDLGSLDVADYLPDDSVLAFRPTTDVVDLTFAAEEQTVQWESPFRDRFKVMSIFTPRVKSTKHNQCGIAFYNGS